MYRVLVKKRKGEGPLGRPRHRWEDNIKMNLQEVEYMGMDWIELTQDREGWRVVSAKESTDQTYLRCCPNWGMWIRLCYFEGVRD
jgi:hypothetical protein